MFSSTSWLPLTRLDFVHTVEAVAEGTRITHRAEFSGPLAFIFRRLVGRGIAAGMPGAVATLARLAEVEDHIPVNP
jgi:hypothetical protein